MSLFGWLSSRDVPPVPEFAGFRDCDSTAPDDDLILKPPDGASGIAGLLVAFSYCDAAGFNSRRRVRCKKIWREGGALYIRGWCSLRNADRTFRVDRITGLLHAPGATPELDPLAYFSQFLAGDPLERATVEQRAWEQTKDGLSVLAYIAICGGQITDKQWESATAYIRARVASQRLPIGDDGVAKLAEHGRSLFPSIQQIAFAARRIEEEPGHLELLAPSIEGVILADGIVSEKELEVLRAFRLRIQRIRKQAIGG